MILMKKIKELKRYNLLQVSVIIFLSSLIFNPLSSMGQQAVRSDSTFNKYLMQAAENNPSLKAEYRRYLSALENVPQATSLPDPQLSFGYFINPVETRIGPQQARFGLTQMFPWFGTLGAKGEAATQMAKATFEDFQEARNSLFFEVQKKWYQLYHIEQAIQIMQENIGLLETFESLATRRYESGQVGQVDVLRVQIEKEDLKTRLELIKDNQQVTYQEFNELLNQSKDQQISITENLVGHELEISLEELKRRILNRNSRLIKFDYKVASAKKMIEAAKKEGLPTFGVGLDYIMVGERNVAVPNNGGDAIMARASIQIPLYRSKYNAKEKQARIDLKIAQDKHHATENRLMTQMEQAIRDYNDAQRRVNLYQYAQIQRTRQAINILTEQYTSSATEFEELLRLQRKLLDYELARETAIVDQNIAIAYIEYLYGKHNVDPVEID